MTNYADSKDILNDQGKIKAMTFKYFGQTTHLKVTTKEEIYARIRACGAALEKYSKKMLQDRQTPCHYKNPSSGPVCLTNNGLWLPNMVSR